MGTWNAFSTGVVVLPCGRRVRGRSLREGLTADDELPDFGLYLTANPHMETRWESRWICWPDFRLPRSAPDAVGGLWNAYELSASVKVEIACGGGTGRTGTAIALLARFADVPADDAVRWVRANYRQRAVETPWQRRFVAHADLVR
jgi:hypothetical protein